MSFVLPFANYAAGQLNQSCQHIAHARIRRQAQGRTLGFHSAGCNIGCHSPLGNCNWCARIDLSSFYRPFDNPFSFMFRHRSGDVFLRVNGWSDLSLSEDPPRGRQSAGSPGWCQVQYQHRLHNPTGCDRNIPHRRPTPKSK